MRKLSAKEEEVMKILWKKEKAFVKEVIDELEEPKPPYNTISSIVRKLENEGFIGHESFGKSHRYYPILKMESYRKRSVSSIVKDYFNNSHEALLSYFVKEKELDFEQLNDLLEKIKNQKD